MSSFHRSVCQQYSKHACVCPPVRYSPGATRLLAGLERAAAQLRGVGVDVVAVSMDDMAKAEAVVSRGLGI
jgi:hypothetical protein